MDREAWSAAVHGLQSVEHDWATELNWTEVWQILHDVTYMWNLKKKNDTNELIYKTEIDPQT